jgi:DNA polymerase sigma
MKVGQVESEYQKRLQLQIRFVYSSAGLRIDINVNVFFAEQNASVYRYIVSNLLSKTSFLFFFCHFQNNST